MVRFYFNTTLKVVAILSSRKGEWLHVNTKSGHRVWWEREVKEIDIREYQRCFNAKVPHNKPRYYIREWKNEN